MRSNCQVSSVHLIVLVYSFVVLLFLQTVHTSLTFECVYICMSVCLSIQDGGVFTCGLGCDGQLGHGQVSNELRPKKVFDLMDKEVTQISCGRYLVYFSLNYML